jgi:hypothetical protein
VSFLAIFLQNSLAFPDFQPLEHSRFQQSQEKWLDSYRKVFKEYSENISSAL